MQLAYDGRAPANPKLRQHYLLLEYIDVLGPRFLKVFEDNIALCQSQLLQDLIYLYVLGPKWNGFFVEVGVGNGVSISNTYLFEKKYLWSGILSEPNPGFATSITNSRQSYFDPRAIFSSSGEFVEFFCDTRGERSVIADFATFSPRKRNGRSLWVPTITLNDLLEHHASPRHIDFISIDTEGSEFDILRCFDFDAFTFGFLCVEHNRDAWKKNHIDEVLHGAGYVQIFSQLSRNDGWYVPELVAQRISTDISQMESIA